MRSVTVVIVTFNSDPDIEECVGAIERDTGISVVVVDNASSDSTIPIVEKLRDRKLVDSLVARRDNGGFAKAVNDALRRVPMGEDILLLNPDAVLAPGVLGQLRKAADDLTSTGVLSPLVRSGPQVKTTTAGRQPTIGAMFNHFSGLSRLFRGSSKFRGRYLYLDGLMKKTETVGWVAGCAMYIKAEAREVAPELSERWFMYAEDTEYCKRVIAAGLDVSLLSDLDCFHEMGSAVRRSNAKSVNVMWPRSLTDYYREKFRPSFAQYVAWRVVFSGGLASRAIVFWVKGIIKRNDNLRAQGVRFVAFARAVWSV